MKIQSITITGMHKIQQQTYEFNPGVTYFVGPNGAGKSTILQAIQLALLGYIPGYAKTKEGIMKHSSGKFLEVSLKLDSGIVITRTWSKEGTSDASKCNVIGYDGENVTDLLDGIELPIFDFNEFTSLTSNKLKEWFISFLPNSTENLDLMGLLDHEITNKALLSEERITDTKQWISDSPLEGVELVKGLNAHLKEEQSFVKGEITKLQGTIQSLIYYDDAPEGDPAELEQKIAALTQQKSAMMKAQAQYEAWDRMMTQVNLLKVQVKGESFESDERANQLMCHVSDLIKKSSAEKEKYAEVQKEITELKYALAAVPVAGASCPYTKEPCETAAKLAESSTAKRNEIQDKLTQKMKESDEHGPLVYNKIDNEVSDIQKEIEKIKNLYKQLEMLTAQIGPQPEKPAGNPGSIDIQINAIQNELIKLKANEQYNKLTETITADKFKNENDLEVLKKWIKYTDANGLQTTLMDKPFENLADDMSTYLSQMFNTPTAAKFNLSTKANSFSFGLTRGDSYIEFDYLSSGEKCLFTLALMMCILDRSQSQIRTIMIDDLLDHLDSANAESLFKSLQGIENIQFILAGVKECGEPSICKQI